MKYISDFFSARFIKFIFAGGFAAVINFSSRILLSCWTNYITAIVIAYIIGMIVAFILSRMIVFEATTGKTKRQITYFTIVNIFAILQTLIVSVLLADLVLPSFGISHYREELAHFIGISIPIFSSYLGHKYFTFTK